MATAPRHRIPGLFRRLRDLHPAQAIVVAFVAAIALGAGLLMLPIARHGPGGADPVTAIFHSASAVCSTGLAFVDFSSYWTTFGLIVLLILVQVGGFGIMTFASILGLVVARKFGLRTRLQTAAESQLVDQGDLRRVLWGVARISLGVEAVIAVLLTLRWWLGYGEPLGHAAWLGIFHSVAAFNNAGFALFSDSMIGFATDPFICLPIAAGVIIGGLGFPVLLELRRELRGSLHWTLNTKMMLAGTAALVTVGTVYVTALEWSNPATLGALDAPARLLAGFFQAVNPRSAGFNSVDVAQMRPETWFGIDILMFVGGGPASTAGGIKVTTFVVLVFIVYSEIRGEDSVNIFGKRLPRATERTAMTVAALAITLVAISTVTVMLIEDTRFDLSIFVVLSSFTTAGMSTGAEPGFTDATKLLLAALMFAGRLGPITVASALALRRTHRLYEYPHERPIIG